MPGRYKPRGWFGEPHRHYLAAKGIKTKKRYFSDRETDYQRHIRKKSEREAQLAQKYNEPKLASVYNSEKFEAVLNLDGFEQLAWTPQVRALVYNPQEDVLIQYTEGDYDVYENPSNQTMQRLLEMYPKGEVSVGEKYDSRFAKDTGANAGIVDTSFFDDEVPPY